MMFRYGVLAVIGVFLIVLTVVGASALPEWLPRGRQVSYDGSAVLQMDYETVRVVSSTGVSGLLNYEVVRVGDGSWLVEACQKPEEEDFIAANPGVQNQLRALPLSSERGNPQIGQGVLNAADQLCGRFGFVGVPGDVVRLGVASTILEISGQNTTVLVTPELEICRHRFCESKIVVNNTGSESLFLNESRFRVDLEQGVSSEIVHRDGVLTYERHVAVCDDEGSLCNVTVESGVGVGDVPLRGGYGVTVAAGSHETFLVRATLPVGVSRVKYNVSVLPVSNGSWFVIDPFFNSSNASFDLGVYADVFRNESGFLQVNVSGGFTSGNYTSEVFDAGENVNWDNFSYFAFPNGTGVRLPDSKVNGFVNMTANVILYHFENLSAFSENDTHVHDFSSSGNGIDCVFAANQCPTEVVAGRFGKAKLFDGVNDHLDVDDNPTFDFGSGSFSYSFFINTTDVGGDQHILGQRNDPVGDGYMSHLDGNLHEMYYDDGAAVTIKGGTVINDGVWHHLVATYDGDADEIRIYADGYLDAVPVSTIGTGNNPSITEAFTIGAHANGQKSINAMIDEVSFWNRTLTPAEVLTIARTGLTDLGVEWRSCDDALCSGESYSSVSYDQFNDSLGVSANQYFQYRARFETDFTNLTPLLYNVSIGYSVIPDVTVPVLVDPNATPFSIPQNSVLNFSVNVTDNESGISFVWVSVNATNYTMSLQGGDVYVLVGFNGSLVGLGLHNATFYANDTVGNVGSNVTTFNVSASACVETWVLGNLTCSELLETVFYVDTESCGTFDNIPADNGTVRGCSVLDCKTNANMPFKRRMPWLCELPDGGGLEDVYCFTQVTQEGVIIQTNPKVASIKNYGTINSFEAQDHLVNAYFTSENLRRGQTYNFSIECWGVNESLGVVVVETTPENIRPSFVPDRLLWGMNNSAWLLASFLMFFVLIAGWHVVRRSLSDRRLF